MTIEPDRAREAIERHLAGPLGVSIDEAAMGVVRILNHNMERAIELNSVRKGYDPRAFSLVAFGGAGPLSGCDIAAELSIPRVVVPRHPGITSALGLLATDLRVRGGAHRHGRGARGRPGRARSGSSRSSRPRAWPGSATTTSRPSGCCIRRVADCRYAGQAYELLVDVPSGAIDRETIAAVEQAFHEQHEREFFWRYTDKPVQLVHLRVYALGLMPELDVPLIEPGSPEPPAGAAIGTFPVGFHGDGAVQRLPTTFWSLARLRAGNVIVGPGGDRAGRLDDRRQPGPPGDGRRVRQPRDRDGAGRMSAERKLDPITLSVIGGAFVAIGREMGHALKRMAYSPAAQQVEDIGGGLFTVDGREICESDTTPLHIGSIPAYIRGFMRRLEGQIDEGDIIIHNHPYHGASHSPDLCVAIPIFWEGEARRVGRLDDPPLRHGRRLPRASRSTCTTCGPSRSCTTR